MAYIVPLLLALAALLPAPALAAATGTITGQVASRSTGAPAVGATSVRLHAFTKATGDEVGDALVVQTDPSGRFSFTSVDTSADKGYVVTAEHRGITYSSGLVVFGSGETSATADIDVYETTDKAQWIWLRQQHVIVTPDPKAGSAQVVEIAIVQNGGDTTFVGVDRGAGLETVRLALPPRAYDVDLGRVLARNAAMQPGAIVYAGPLRPGQTELVVTYTVDLEGGALTLPKVFTLDADAVDVLVEDVGLTPRSAQLEGPTATPAGGKRFLRLTGRGLAAGTVVSIELAGSAASPSLTSALPLVGLAALVLATAYLLLAPRLRRRRDATPEAAVPRARRARAEERDDASDEILVEADA